MNKKVLMTTFLILLSLNTLGYSTRNCNSEQIRNIDLAQTFLSENTASLVDRLSEEGSAEGGYSDSKIQKFIRTLQGDMRIVCKESDSRACKKRTGRTWVFTKRIDICYEKIKNLHRRDTFTHSFCALVGRIVHEASHVARIPVNWREHNLRNVNRNDVIYVLDLYAASLCSFDTDYKNLEL